MVSARRRGCALWLVFLVGILLVKLLPYDSNGHRINWLTSAGSPPGLLGTVLDLEVDVRIVPW